MKSSWNIKGRDYLHVETGEQATVLDIRVYPSGDPRYILLQTADGHIQWTTYMDFNQTYIRVVPDEPVKRSRRQPDADNLDTLWQQALRDAA